MIPTVCIKYYQNKGAVSTIIIIKYTKQNVSLEKKKQKLNFILTIPLRLVYGWWANHPFPEHNIEILNRNEFSIFGIYKYRCWGQMKWDILLGWFFLLLFSLLKNVKYKRNTLKCLQWKRFKMEENCIQGNIVPELYLWQFYISPAFERNVKQFFARHISINHPSFNIPVINISLYSYILLVVIVNDWLYCITNIVIFYVNLPVTFH